MTAVAVFLVGSVLCGFAWNLPSLIGFRVLQGLGGGMVLPVTISILSRAAGPSRMGRAMAAIALPAQLAPILGPVINGTILDSLNWNWLFFINVPTCLVALVLAAVYLAPERGQRDRRLDFPGFLMLTPGLVAIAYGISRAGGPDAFAAVKSWLPIAAGVALVLGFVLYALRTRRAPLVAVRLFARRSFGLSSIITFAAGFSSYAGMFLLPLFYQELRGESTFATGLLLIPQGLGAIVFLLIQSQVAKRFDMRLIVAGGVILTVLGILPFVFTGASGSDVLLLVCQFVRGFGISASALPIMTLAFTSLSREETPRASAAFSVVQRVGAPFGVTVVAVILETLVAHAGSSSVALAGAFAATFWWIIAFSAVPLVLAFFLPRPAAAPAGISGAETPRKDALVEA